MAKRIRSRKPRNVNWKSINIDPYTYREKAERGERAKKEKKKKKKAKSVQKKAEAGKAAGGEGAKGGSQSAPASARAGDSAKSALEKADPNAPKKKRKPRSPAVKKKLKKAAQTGPADQTGQAAQTGQDTSAGQDLRSPTEKETKPPSELKNQAADSQKSEEGETNENEDDGEEDGNAEPVQDPESVKDLDLSAWSGFSLNPLILNGLRSQGFSAPTPIQSLALAPAILFKKDIIGAAQTGSGKTLAFGIPILQELLENPPPVENKQLSALIMTPTRELGLQIVEHLNRLLMKNHVNQDPNQRKIKIVPIVGGIALQKQERLLNSKPDIVVATPGRFWERMQQVNYIRYLDELRFLVIDEADRMIEHGHFKELENILTEIKFSDPETNSQITDDRMVREVQANAEIIEDRPKKENKSRRQTFIFSATITLTEEGRKRVLSGAVKKKVKKIKMYKKQAETEKPNTMDRLMELVNFQRKVEIVDVTNKQKLTAESLTETKIDCMKDEKDIYMYYFFLKYPGRTLVFVNSITCIRRLVPIFKLLKLPVMGIHASMQQRKRLKNLDRFKANDRSILISTDVLSRGVDIPSVEHVIHYQVPRTTENYIHRSGRTARATATGISLMLVSPEEVKQYRSISYVLSNEQDSIPDFPVDLTYLTMIKKRVNVAIELDRLENTSSRKKSDNTFYKQQAAALDIELDEQIVREQFEDDSDVEQKKNHRVEQLKAELDQLLDKTILPKGASSLYITHHKFEALDGTTKHDAISDFNAKPKEKRKRVGKKNRPWNPGKKE